MDDSIHELIATISPDIYCQKEKETKDGEIIKDLPKYIKKIIEQNGYTGEDGAVKEVKILKASDVPSFNYDKAKADALNLWGLKAPLEQHKLIYDSPAEGLEPIYFWLLDFLGVGLGGGMYRTIKKITDNFISSPGSGHFSEMQGKATQMQQEVSRTMGNVNTVLKSVLNLVYDLKEFRLRLKPYKDYKNKDSSEEDKFKHLLSLKQVWLDNVDIRKGRGSINALSSGELDFVTLRDAFMSLKSLKDISFEDDKKGLDLNQRVKRILHQRGDEFFRWIEESFNSLSQRYEIERNYLKSQVNMLKMYSRWVKPYLKAAQKLEQNSGNLSKNAGLVTAFNTMILELKLLAYSEYDIKDDVATGLVPDLFNSIKTRKYFKVLIVELEFRSIPQRVSQRGDWSFGGKAEIRFTSYGLNEEEIKVLETELEKDDLNSVMKLIDGATDESLKQIDKDIRALLENKEESQIEKEDEEKKKADEEKKAKKGDDFGLNSFFSAFKIKKKPKEKTDLTKPLRVDDKYEMVVRSQAILSSNESCFTTFDTYKKAHGMPSHTDPYRPLG